MTAETRTVIPQVDPMRLRVMDPPKFHMTAVWLDGLRVFTRPVQQDLSWRIDYTSEETRLAYFRQSAATVAGRTAPFRRDVYPLHEKTT